MKKVTLNQAVNSWRTPKFQRGMLRRKETGIRFYIRLSGILGKT